VYQYGEGLARFATEPYTLDDIQATCSNTPPRQPLSLQPSAFSPSTGETTHPGLQGRCAHLTNYSLNKLSAGFVNDDSEASGSKWSLAAFKQRRTPECRGGRGEGAERSLPGDTLPPCRLLREVGEARASEARAAGGRSSRREAGRGGEETRGVLLGVAASGRHRRQDDDRRRSTPPPTPTPPLLPLPRHPTLAADVPPDVSSSPPGVESIMVEGMQEYLPSYARGEPNRQCFQASTDR